MSDQDDINGKVTHYIGKLQSEILSTRNVTTKSNLHWGQFVVEPKAKAQVGVYGSTCAAIILRLYGRDDSETKQAKQSLMTFVAQNTDNKAAEEFAHNIKLAMLVFALAPRPGEDAGPQMLAQLDQLLERCTSATHLWPAYTSPQCFLGSNFVPRDSEVATAVILIFLYETLKCLDSQKYVALRGKAQAVVDSAALALEAAYSSERLVSQRHSALLATAVILTKGSKAKRGLSSAFSEAAQVRDFADRRVFFYECLRGDGNFSRDYFILPPAVILPLVMGKASANRLIRAKALTVVRELFSHLDEKGLFRGGQDMPSTVEQAFVGLSLQAAAESGHHSDIRYYLARSWTYATQPNPNGTPTKLIFVIVALLWAATGVALLGKQVPVNLRSNIFLGTIYDIASLPEAVPQFLAFVTGAWPASRVVFARLVQWRK